MSKTATIGHVVGLAVMRVLAARISKTAISWRTRGPDDRRGQLRFVARVWLAIVNPVRQRAALMVLRMHSVTVGMAGDNESSAAGMTGVVSTVRQQPHGRDGLLYHGCKAPDSPSVRLAHAAARDSTTRSRYGSWGEARLVRFTSSHTRQTVNRPLPTNNRFCDGLRRLVITPLPGAESEHAELRTMRRLCR